MKKSKIGVFAVLGTLSISTIAVVAIVGHDNVLSQYDATVPCTLTWKAGQGLTVDAGGAGTFVNSHVETTYGEASVDPTHHVVLGFDGYMQTSGKAWDGSVGGYVNGMTSITVNFTTTAGIDYENMSDDASLFLDAGFATASDVKSDVYVTDGEEITFSPSFAPRSFRLEYRATSMGAEPSVAKIESVVVKCSMVATHTFELNKVDQDVDYTKLIWAKGADAKTALDRDKLNKLQLVKGDIISVRSPDDAVNYLTKEDITATGATITSRVIAPNAYETIFIEANDDTVVSINTHHTNIPYQGRSFVGTYTVANAETKALTTLQILETGKITVDGKTIDYTADDADNISLASSSESVTLNNGFIRAKINNKTYIGAKGTNVTIPTLLRSNKWDSADIIVEATVDGTTTLLYVYRDSILVSGTHDVTITKEKLGLNAQDAYVIDAKTPEAVTYVKKFGNFNDMKAYQSGDIYQLILAVTPDKIELIDAFDDAGTYKCNGKSDLEIDVFKNAKIDGVTATKAVNSKTNEVTINDKKYEINPTTKTYVELVVYNGEQWTTPTTYVLFGGSDELTFDNGNVTLKTTKSGFTKKTATYTVADSIVKFSLEHEADPDSSYWTVPAKFELKLNADKTALTVVSAKTDDGYLSLTLYAKGATFELPKVVADPWATTPGVYSDGTQTITLNNGKISISKKYGLDKDTVDYKYDGEKIVATFSFFDPYEGTVKTIAKFTVASDLSSITSTSSVYDSSEMGANTVFGSGTVYNKVTA